MQLVQQFLHSSAERFPSKPAVVCDGRTVTYGEFSAGIRRIGENLAASGLRPGDRVIVHLPEKIDFLVAVYGTMESGGIAVPVADTAPASTLLEVAADCTPAVIVTGNPAAWGAASLPGSCRVLPIEELRREIAPRANPAGAVHPEAGDGALIHYTFGPDGMRKGAYYTHQNLVQVTLNILQFSGIDSSVAEVISGPLTQSFALGRIHTVLFAGGTAVLARASHEGIIERLSRGEGNSFAGTSDTIGVLLDSADGLLKHIGPSVRFVALRGPSFALQQRKRMLELFPHARICMDYGMTEGMYNTGLEFHSDRKKIETAGRRLPSVELAICDEQVKHLGRGLIGEIYLRGDHLMTGYWRENAVRQDGFTEDRWFRTGDIGFIDKDGYLHILGRKDELINLRGMRFSPLEVEERIHAAYPDYEICVVGIPDPVGAVGEIPVLCYIPRDGKTIIPSELSNALSGALDQNKIPRIVYRMHEFPRLGNKILRRELRRRLLAGADRAIENVP